MACGLLKEYGYTKKQIQRIMSFNNISDEIIERTILYLQDKKYTKKQIKKMTTEKPRIFYILPQTMEDKRDYFLSKGYAEEEINRLTCSNVSLYTITNKTLDSKREYLLKKGLNDADINKMTLSLATLYTFSEKKLEQIRNILGDVGFTEEELNFISLSFPAIYSCCEASLEKKLGYFDIHELTNFIKSNPKNLIQGVELTYSRNMFLLSLGYEEKPNLFDGEKGFVNKFEMTNEEVKDLYPYFEYEQNLLLGGYMEIDENTETKKYVKTVTQKK